MTHIVGQVHGGQWHSLAYRKAGDIVKYIGPSNDQVKNGEFFVVTAFFKHSVTGEDVAILGRVTLDELNRDGVEARDRLTRNLISSLEVRRPYWRHFAEYVFIT